MLLTSLKTLDGDAWRGLAPGQLAVFVDQDRPPAYLLYNVVKDTVAFSQKFRIPRPISPRHGYSRIAPVGATSTLIKDLLSRSSPFAGHLSQVVTEAVLYEFFHSVGLTSYSCR